MEESNPYGDRPRVVFLIEKAGGAFVCLSTSGFLEWGHCESQAFAWAIPEDAERFASGRILGDWLIQQRAVH